MKLAAIYAYQLTLPILGGATVVIVYALIIAKRMQRISLILSGQEAFEENIVKITDYSENLWWKITTAILFLSYIGFILFFSRFFNIPRIHGILFFGILIWILISYIGFRITKRRKQKIQWSDSV
ncbi:MAG: hypothetical protein PVJ52_01255 [Candidatus Woesebacteria bacterium]|jgi:hypothetical protein